MLKTLIKIRLQGILLKQTKSSKKKKGNSIGKIILMALLFGYVGVVFVVMFGMLFDTIIQPLHMLGIDWLYFALMSIVIIMLCFIGSVFLTYHEIYEAKDNELLLAMPIKNMDILLSRVFSILILNYVYEILVAGPAFFIFFKTCGMSIIQVIMFLLVFLTLPLFVLALSCLFGWILAHVLVHVKMKNVIAIVLYLSFMFVYLYAVNSIEEYIGWLISNGQTIASAIEKSVFPLYHLSIALQEGNLLSLLIYLVCALVPFGVVIYLLSIHFIELATTKPKAKKVEYVAKPMKSQSVNRALLKREFQHFTSNAMVMINGAVGIVFCMIGAVALVMYADDIHMLLEQLPGIQNYLTPLLCLAAISACSMNIISASSVSLEGNRLWILKTLPVATIDILNTKLILHLVFCAPAGMLLSVVISIVFKVHLWDAVLIIIAPILFTILVDLLGLLLNLWKPKFDWVNETVCVKHSMPVMLTMFIAMGLAFVVAALYLFVFADYMSINIYMYVCFIVFIIADIALYYLLQTWGVKRFDEL